MLGDVSDPGVSMSFWVGAYRPRTVVKAEVTSDQLIPDNQPAGIRSDLVIPKAGFSRRSSRASRSSTPTSATSRSSSYRRPARA